MDEQTKPKQTPLTPTETAAKLREKPHTLICCEEDSLDMLAGLVRQGFYFVPVKEGHWELFDTEDASVKSELLTDRLLKKGQNYVVEVPEPSFSKPIVLEFPPLSSDNVTWNRFMCYGFNDFTSPFTPID